MRPDECCDKTVVMMNSNSETLFPAFNEGTERDDSSVNKYPLRTSDAVGRDVSMRHTDTITPEVSKRGYCAMVSVDT